MGGWLPVRRHVEPRLYGGITVFCSLKYIVNVPVGIIATKTQQHGSTCFHLDLRYKFIIPRAWYLSKALSRGRAAGRSKAEDCCVQTYSRHHRYVMLWIATPLMRRWCILQEFPTSNEHGKSQRGWACNYIVPWSHQQVRHSQRVQETCC